ncbi:hypothetical protein GCM10009863_34180 [Streptomyces axinellae]|uniref:Uncharacterized protein n=1 Tax=Streptomyces axinellae TaxID=552788 RepID=A0ABP6CHS0_9ACTN
MERASEQALLDVSPESPAKVAYSLLLEAQQAARHAQEDYAAISGVLSETPENDALNTHAALERCKQAQENVEVWRQAREWLAAQGPQGWGRIVPTDQRAARAVERASAAYSIALEEPGPRLVRLRESFASQAAQTPQHAQTPQSAQAPEVPQAAHAARALRDSGPLPSASRPRPGGSSFGSSSSGQERPARHEQSIPSRKHTRGHTR